MAERTHGRVQNIRGGPRKSSLRGNLFRLRKSWSLPFYDGLARNPVDLGVNRAPRLGLIWACGAHVHRVRFLLVLRPADPAGEIIDGLKVGGESRDEGLGDLGCVACERHGLPASAVGAKA